MIYHKDLEGRFKNLSIFEQMANTGAELLTGAEKI